MPHLKLNEFSKTHKIIAVTILCIFTLIGIISVNSGQFDIVYLTLRGNDYKIFGRLLPLILDNFFGTATFFHPNWWKVLLGIIGFIIAGFLILEKVLLNYNAIHEETDNGMLPMAWLIYYFAAAGCFFGLQAFPGNGHHSFIHLFRRCGLPPCSMSVLRYKHIQGPLFSPYRFPAGIGFMQRYLFILFCNDMDCNHIHRNRNFQKPRFSGSCGRREYAHL